MGIQRVSRACVRVEGEVRGEISKGLCVLVGIHRSDTREDVLWCAKKLLNIRLFESEDGKHWNKSAQALDLGILAVSQFTLHAFLKGNKPDFHLAMGGDQARDLFDQLVEELKKGHTPERIATGVFGAMMEVDLVNDGPVTIELDSESTRKKKPGKEES